MGATETVRFAEILAMVLFSAFAPSDAEPLPAEQVLWAMPSDCEFMAFADLRDGGPRLGPCSPTS